MELTQNVNAWLGWLSRVRLLVITLVLSIVLLLRQYSFLSVPTRHFVPLIIVWYTLGILHGLLLRWLPRKRWHAPLEMVCDLLMVTCLVYITGAHDSYFVSLYLADDYCRQHPVLAKDDFHHGRIQFRPSGRP